MGFWGKLFDIILLIILVPIVILKFIFSWLTGKSLYGEEKKKNPHEIEAEFSVEDAKPEKTKKADS